MTTTAIEPVPGYDVALRTYTVTQVAQCLQVSTATDTSARSNRPDPVSPHRRRSSRPGAIRFTTADVAENLHRVYDVGYDTHAA